MSIRKYFGILRVCGRPAYTHVAMRTLAHSAGFDRVSLYVLFTETAGFTLQQMRYMAKVCGLEVSGWIAAPKASRHMFRVALAFMRSAVDEGYDRCLWMENDTAYNSPWFVGMEELYDRVSALPDTPTILWSQAINNNLPSIHKIEREDYILAHRSGKVAMMIDAEQVRRIPLFDDRWNQVRPSDSIIEELFGGSAKTTHRFLWPKVSTVDHIGRRGVSTMTVKAFELSRGIGFEPEPHVVEALEWLKSYENDATPHWLRS